MTFDYTIRVVEISTITVSIISLLISCTVLYRNAYYHEIEMYYNKIEIRKLSRFAIPIYFINVGSYGNFLTKIKIDTNKIKEDIFTFALNESNSPVILLKGATHVVNVNVEAVNCDNLNIKNNKISFTITYTYIKRNRLKNKTQHIYFSYFT